MTREKGLVLDANILIRAVFGNKVRRIIEAAEGEFVFYCPDFCIDEAHQHVPAIAERNGKALSAAVSTLSDVLLLITSVSRNFYRPLRTEATARIAARDPNDWHVVAAALFLDLAIWTEDYDFFGCGVATWTTDRIELYLKS